MNMDNMVDMNSIPICFSISIASSDDARGIMPGSENEVQSKVVITNKKRAPPIIGITRVT